MQRESERLWQIIETYLRVFKEGQNPSELVPLLCADLDFSGPSLSCSTSAEYVSILNQTAVKPMKIGIRQRYNNQFSYSVIYTVEKSDGLLWVCQIFQFREDKISNIRTIFDSKQLG